MSTILEGTCRFNRCDSWIDKSEENLWRTIVEFVSSTAHQLPLNASTTCMTPEESYVAHSSSSTSFSKPTTSPVECAAIPYWPSEESVKSCNVSPSDARQTQASPSPSIWKPKPESLACHSALSPSSNVWIAFDARVSSGSSLCSTSIKGT